MSKPKKNELVIQQLYQAPLNNAQYTYYFDDVIGPPAAYRDLSQVLATAREGDTINLMINSPGGYVKTAAQLCNLIQNCRATVIGHLVGPSASAATSLFLACHSWVVHPFSTLMGHTFSGGFYGKGDEAKDSFDSTSKFVQDMMLELYYPFFTEEELDDMWKNNRDIFLDVKEIQRRLDILVAYRYPDNQ